MFSKTKQWLLTKMQSSKAWAWLSVISFAESSFFPIPVDFFLIPIVISQKYKWVFYTFVATITSVLGGVAGYLIGLLLYSSIGEPIVATYGFESEVIQIGQMFDSNAFWAIFTAAFTPIPYKIFTISAGLFKINIISFIVASFFGRFIRYFILDFLLYKFGQRVGVLVFKYFNQFLIAIIVFIMVYLAIFVF